MSFRDIGAKLAAAGHVAASGVDTQKPDGCRVSNG
jgi:hypothetical protein